MIETKRSDKKTDSNTQKTVWRNTDRTEECVSKLEEILRIDWTVKEACSYANIARTTYYEWLKVDELFKNRMEDASEYAFIVARKTINKAIREWDGKLALDIMRRRDKRYRDKSDNNMTWTVSLLQLHGETVENDENWDDSE